MTTLRGTRGSPRGDPRQRERPVSSQLHPAVHARHSGLPAAVHRVPPRESRLVMSVPSPIRLTASSPSMILRTVGALR
jgi:hypothetical protein